MTTTKRTFRAIAIEIKATWKNIYFGAEPYLRALYKLDTTDPQAPYYLDTAETIVRYFLANASAFRGPEAKRLKNELKSMI